MTETIAFDNDVAGRLPAGWIAGVTGRGAAHWSVDPDPSAPSQPKQGRRITIKYVDAPVAKKQWHTLRVEFAGARIRVALDGTMRIAVEDTHITGPGAVGVWTKADSVTVFDDFSFAAAPSAVAR